MSDRNVSEGQAFAQKNQEDFDRNTGVLTNGLMEIAGSTKLKPTIAELSRITGIHRNTIRQRIWPAQRLLAIKESRVIETLRKNLAKEKKVDPLNVLTEKLQASRLEVLHWFNYSKELADKNKHLKQEIKIQVESKNFYINRLAEIQQKNLESEREIDKLRAVIDVLENAQAEKD